MSDLPGSVLFACTLNSVRSPMAEALGKHLLGHRIYFDSVGVRTGEIDGFAVAVMEEMGIHLSGHVAKTFDDLEDTSFDLIVSLSPEAQHRAVELTRHHACELEYWPTVDPTATPGQRDTKLAAYRDLRDQLFERIAQRFRSGGGPVV